jgi:hypothetical protein
MLDDLRDRPPIGTWFSLPSLARYTLDGTAQPLVLGVQMMEQLLRSGMHPRGGWWLVVGDPL